jgi:hypothetical protein
MDVVYKYITYLKLLQVSHFSKEIGSRLVFYNLVLTNCHHNDLHVILRQN